MWVNNAGMLFQCWFQNGGLIVVVVVVGLFCLAGEGEQVPESKGGSC